MVLTQHNNMTPTLSRKCTSADNDGNTGSEDMNKVKLMEQQNTFERKNRWKSKKTLSPMKEKREESAKSPGPSFRTTLSPALLGARYSSHSIKSNELPSPPPASGNVSRRRRNTHTSVTDEIRHEPENPISPTDLSNKFGSRFRDEERNSTENKNDDRSIPRVIQYKEVATPILTRRNNFRGQTLSQRKARLSRDAVYSKDGELRFQQDAIENIRPTQISVDKKRAKVREEIQEEILETRKRFDDYHRKIAMVQRSEADVGVPLCSVSRNKNLSFPESAESQRHDQLRNAACHVSVEHNNAELNVDRDVEEGNKPGFTEVQETDESAEPGRNIPSILSIILRSAVIILSICSIAARTAFALSGKMSLAYYIKGAPELWAVRLYIAIFHFNFVLAEMRVHLPPFCPNRTLGEYIPRGFLISFIGLLDIFMSSNKSFQEIVADIQTLGLTTNGRINAISLLVLKITSRGLVACGMAYFVFGIFGWSEKSFKRQPSANA
mmetsp:Transcript_31280/g.63790  ORF Transcript_31280/g.63790 Transcript_31280/m.63790 type:complete len:496 (-) Transcript_31280:866-2353(-)